jgi:hypothetical protein
VGEVLAALGRLAPQGKVIVVFVADLAPGAAGAKHYHRGRKFFYVLEGTCREPEDLPFPRHHRRQQLVKHLIDLLRREPLHRSGPVQFVVDLVEDFAKLARQRDHPFAVHIVGQLKSFNRNTTVLGLDCEVDGLSGVGGGDHRAILAHRTARNFGYTKLRRAA